MLPILISDLYNYLALAVMLLAILFAYRKGRNVVSASSQSLAWTQVPLIPNPIDQNPWAHWRSPMDMMRQG